MTLLDLFISFVFVYVSLLCITRDKPTRMHRRNMCTTQLQTQYVVGKDDLQEIISGIVDGQLERFFARMKQEAEADHLITPRDASEQLGVNLTTLWRWHNEGYLTKVYIGDKPRYRQSDINRILKGGAK